MPIANQLVESAAEIAAECEHDPLAYVKAIYPWGEGELVGIHGPRQWQTEELAELGAHLQNSATRYRVYQKAIVSGNGPGKSALVGMISKWAMSTCDMCRVIITANTGTQLSVKTQPEVAKWFQRADDSILWDIQATRISIDEVKYRAGYRLDFETWSENNPEAISGLHNLRKRIVVIFDEASGIPQVIWDHIQGAFTDAETEMIFLAFGNGVHRDGPFADCFKSSAWEKRHIDTRDVPEGMSKEQIAALAETYGEESDWFRVHVRGLFPVSSSAQYIDQDLIVDAQHRNVIVMEDEPLVAGVDFAWGGSDDNVIRFRRGADARSIPPIKIKGEFTRDPAVLTGKLADVLTREYDGTRLAMLFMDSAGIAAPVEKRLRQLGHENLMTVNFGAHSPDLKHAYMRDYMWGEMKEWLRNGAIDADAGLAADLGGPCLVSDKQQRVKLEAKELMKKRGLDSPDDADALALTFAMPVASQEQKQQRQEAYREPPRSAQGWMI